MMRCMRGRNGGRRKLKGTALAVGLSLALTGIGNIPARAADAEEPAYSRLGGRIQPTLLDLSEEEMQALLQEKANASEQETDSVPGSVKYDSSDAGYWKSLGTDYYYNQLSDAEKTLWDRLEEDCLDVLWSSEEMPCAWGDMSGLDLPSDFDVYNFSIQFSYSNPQYYFLSNAYGYYNSYFLIPLYDEFQDGANRASATAQFRGQIDSWISGMNQASDPEAKEKIAFDVICNTVRYDYDGMNTDMMNQSAYSAVVRNGSAEHSSVCAGYSKTFTILMNGVGIETVPCTSDEHAWNLIHLYDYWYEVDPTWGDQTDDGYPIWYDYYNTSYGFITGEGDEDGFHIAEEALAPYLPQMNYDTLANDDYHSGYFTDSKGKYFVVNEVGSNLALMVQKYGNTVPQTASAEFGGGRTYDVIGTWGISEDGGSDDNGMGNPDPNFVYDTNVVSVNGEIAVIKDPAAQHETEVPAAVVQEGLVYRMYDQSRGEHFYTKSAAERDALIGMGWKHEEDADFAVISADEDGAIPVYRLYNPNGGGMHFYTADMFEARNLASSGWKYEGISHYVYSAGSGKGTPQYRVYNPNSDNGEHNWTSSWLEYQWLVNDIGWDDEGECWQIQ